MNNPYGVLGIGRDASEEEIKKTYKALSRKYHPDANINNPNQDQAEEKFKEIQAAYQQIMKERTEGYQGDNGYGGGYGNAQGPFGSGPFGSGPFGSGPFGGFQGRYQQADTGYEENSRLRAAGNYLRNGYYREAHTTLEGMSVQERNARWFYYSAIANSGLGNNVVALEHARRAVAMEPHNMSYQSLLQRFESGGNWYEQRQASYGYPKNQGSDICVKLCWANMLLSFCTGCGGCYGGRCI